MSEQVLDFDAIFNKYMAGNQKTWSHDRNTTVGASEVFGCMRAVWFDKLGETYGFEKDPDEVSWGGMERGNIIENHFLVPGITAGLPDTLELKLAGKGQKTLIADRASATPDGLIVGLDPSKPLVIRAGERVIKIDNLEADCIVLEFKSIDPRVTLEEEKAKHFGQTQMQLGLIREKTKHKPVYSIILYVNASFVDHFTPFVTKFDPNIYKQGRQRAEEIYTIENPLDIVPEGKLDGGCKHCVWKTACGEATVAAIPLDTVETDPLDVSLMDAAIDEYNEAKTEKEHAERQFEITKENVKELLTNIGTKKFKTPLYSVSWYGQKGRKVVDTKAMAADGIDLEPYTREGAPFDQLRITMKTDEVK